MTDEGGGEPSRRRTPQSRRFSPARTRTTELTSLQSTPCVTNGRSEVRQPMDCTIAQEYEKQRDGCLAEKKVASRTGWHLKSKKSKHFCLFNHAYRRVGGEV